MTPPTPAALHTGVTDLLDTIGAVQRQVRDLQLEYAMLTTSHLSIDDLGPTVSAEEALAASKLALASVDDALICVVDAIYDAMQYSSRLKPRL